MKPLNTPHRMKSINQNQSNRQSRSNHQSQSNPQSQSNHQSQLNPQSQSNYQSQSNFQRRSNHQNQANHHSQVNQWNRFIFPLNHVVFPFFVLILLMGLGCSIHHSSIKAKSEQEIKKSNEPEIKKSGEPEKEKPLSAALPALPDEIGKEKEAVLKGNLKDDLKDGSSTPHNEANEPAIKEPATGDANKPEGKEAAAPEKGTLISSSQPSRPDWIGKETVLKDGYLTLVGISEDCATEKLSIAGAMKDAQAKIVEYLGKLAKLEFKRMTVSNDFASKIIDPNSTTRSYQEFLAADIARRAKDSEEYREEWSTPAGVVYRSFVLVRMPQAIIDNSMKGFTRYNAVKVRQTIKNSTDKKAKKQARKTIEFWMNIDPTILTK